MTAESFVVRNADVDGRRADVRIRNGVVDCIDTVVNAARGETVVDAEGGALLPGLHDHHIHLIALAAARGSLDLAAVTPTPSSGADQRLGDRLVAAHRALPADSWLRVVGYHESMEPDLDRWWLDRFVPDRPVRVQHRSGRQWILNSRALELCAVGTLSGDTVETDSSGVPTGRITGLDDVLGRRWSGSGDLDSLIEDASAELAAYGVTGLTDATPYSAADDLGPLLSGLRSRRIVQRLTVTCAPSLVLHEAMVQPAEIGPAKVIVADHLPMSIEGVVAQIELARGQNRCVAIHCVTRVGLIVCLAAFDEIGARNGDRIEHGAVVDADLAARLAEHGLVVVTQPNFVFERGDRYLADVDPDDRDHLYPCGSLRSAGVRVGGSTDAPFGHPDPWRAMRSAVDRRTSSGQAIGEHERISPAEALALFLTPPNRPGSSTRRVVVGAGADLCLLDRSQDRALLELTAGSVRRTWVGGRLVFANDR